MADTPPQMTSDAQFQGCLVNRAHNPVARLLFAHGAGAPMDSDFMNIIAQGLSEQGIEVVRFEFPYMAERRVSGKRRPPPPFAGIVTYFADNASQWAQDLPLFVGGKSMGGRAAASLVVPSVRGAVAWGYPLHPAGKPERLRLAPLQARASDLLIVQGDRDALGNRETFERQSLDAKVSVTWLTDGDHDLKPRKKSGSTHAEHLASAVDAAAEFIKARI